jgi:manganese/zinc/iron transport system permease protein
MLGDAISHAVLPGIATAFVLTGSRGILPMLCGAILAGLCAAAVTSLLHRSKLASEDSALGVVFTSFFALGVIIMTWATRKIDLDVGCILYGLPEFIPFDTVPVADLHIPRSFLVLTGAFLLNLVVVLLFYKELCLTVFDPTLATISGFSPRVVHYALIFLTTITVVAAFEAVGSVLVVALLVAPPATAYLLCTRLSSVLGVAMLVGSLSSALGYLLALSLNTSVAGSMSVSAGVLFGVTVVFAPSSGIISRWCTRALLRLRIVQDDILGMLYRWHEVSGQNERRPLFSHDVYAALGRSLYTMTAKLLLFRKGDITRHRDSTLRLTERGLMDARAIVRSHRLWETYLATHLGLPLDHLHAPSERAEHYIGRALARDIEDDVVSPVDPHGRDIPKGGDS